MTLQLGLIRNFFHQDADLSSNEPCEPQIVSLIASAKWGRNGLVWGSRNDFITGLFWENEGVVLVCKGVKMVRLDGQISPSGVNSYLRGSKNLPRFRGLFWPM